MRQKLKIFFGAAAIHLLTLSPVAAQTDAEARVLNVIQQTRAIIENGEPNADTPRATEPDVRGMMAASNTSRPEFQAARKPPPAVPISLPVRKIRDGALPVDENYWRFHRWYRNHFTLTLVVDSSDGEALKSVIAKLIALEEDHVLVDEVLVNGTDGAQEFLTGGIYRRTEGEVDSRNNPAAHSPKVQPTELGLLARRAGLVSGELQDIGGMLRSHSIEYLPAWIVRYRGNDYVYEGAVDLKRIFDRSGAFLGAGSGSHLRRPNGNRFVNAETVPRPGMVYRNPAGPLPSGAGTSDAVPRCEAAAVRNAAIRTNGPELEDYDLLLYDFEDPSQLSRAKSYPLPEAPYLEGDQFNPYRPADGQQPTARLFAIRCLPTRVHFTKKSGARLLEYREGSAAWK